MKKVLRLYVDAYRGLSPAAWMLALVMLINRAGSMVLPFMSVYLTTDLKFSVTDAGILMGIFGVGSMAGSLLGGWLTDKIGQFKVQTGSLVLGGLFFFTLPAITNFYVLAVALFILSTITDALRPANSSSVALYAKPENVTRAFSLNRMSVNLGFSVGPAIGGLLAAISYKLLFFVDGVSCLIAGAIFYFFFRNRTTYGRTIPEPTASKGKSAWQDTRFLLFCLLCTGFATVFFQLFTTLPLFYKEEFHLEEGAIGLLLGLNGLVVFLLEMVIVNVIGSRINAGRLIAGGLILLGISLAMLNFAEGTALLYISMILLSLAEIFAMPFMVTYVTNRSNEGNRGSYMGLYSFAYASAFVLAPVIGTFVAASYGFDVLWWLMAASTVVTAAGFFWLLREQPGQPSQGSLMV